MAMDKTTKTLIIGGSILAGAVVLTIMGKKVIEKAKEKKMLKRQEVLDMQQKDTNLSTQTETASGYNPSGDMKLMEGYIVGANFFTYQQEVNAIVFKLSDIELKKLADAWKKKHKSSLYHWLDDEWDSCGTWGFSDCYESAKARLSKLGKR